MSVNGGLYDQWVDEAHAHAVCHDQQHCEDGSLVCEQIGKKPAQRL